MERLSIPLARVQVMFNDRDHGLGYKRFRPSVSTFNLHGREVHGTCFLFSEFDLAAVPSTRTVSEQKLIINVNKIDLQEQVKVT